jgi:hypothetical protein
VVTSDESRSAPFKMRKDIFFHEDGLISIPAYWMTLIHIPFTQFNITAIGLGYCNRVEIDILSCMTFVIIKQPGYVYVCIVV